MIKQKKSTSQLKFEFTQTEVVENEITKVTVYMKTPELLLECFTYNVINFPTSNKKTDNKNGGMGHYP